MHYAIQKLHWGPSQIGEWVDADQQVQALYYASLSVKAKSDREEASKARAKSRGRKG